MGPEGNQEQRGPGMGADHGAGKARRPDHLGRCGRAGGASGPKAEARGTSAPGLQPPSMGQARCLSSIPTPHWSSHGLHSRPPGQSRLPSCTHLHPTGHRAHYTSLVAQKSPEFQPKPPLYTAAWGDGPHRTLNSLGWAKGMGAVQGHAGLSCSGGKMKTLSIPSTQLAQPMSPGPCGHRCHAPPTGAHLAAPCPECHDLTPQGLSLGLRAPAHREGHSLRAPPLSHTGAPPPSQRPAVGHSVIQGPSGAPPTQCWTRPRSSSPAWVRNWGRPGPPTSCWGITQPAPPAPGPHQSALRNAGAF